MMLTCRLLGPVEISSDDQRIDLGYRRHRALLAILLVDANRLVTLDALIDRTWGEHPPATATATLYADLSKLRRALAPIPGLQLVRHAGGYRIDIDPATIDLHRFRDLVARTQHSDNDEDTAALLNDALALWRDEPFADLDNPWLTTVRTSLNREKHAALLERNDTYLRLGRHTHLLADLAALTTAHPLDERLAAQYLVALYRCGRASDALSHYRHIRDHLVEELGVDPGPQLQELHTQILRNDPHLRTTTAAPAATRPPTPRQLPPQATHFVGRAMELSRLTSLVDTTVDTGGTVMITAIGGAGGIGKTWLALYWAHIHADRFPDGQLFVDLRGFTPSGQPMTPQTAVRGFLDGLGVESHRIPADLDAQVALYRSTLVGKRMLIVLDNAADSVQITPLLPGSPTCTVLITSRRYLVSLVTGHHAHNIPLDVLTDTEARRLLSIRLGAERVAAEPDAVDTLLACCAGFPLALGIVIGRALGHPKFPLSVLAAELTETGSALGALDDADAPASLPAVLSWSMRALTTEQAHMFKLLSIAPGPDISLPATASLAALPEREARAVLRELEHASLIQQHVPGRYRMHDLIRRYAADTAEHDLTQDEQEATLRRVVDFYTHTAHTADRLMDPHRRAIPLDPPAPGIYPQRLSDNSAAMAWFDAERQVLLATQDVAARRAWYPTVWQLAWAANTFFARRGQRHDRLAMWRSAVDAAAHMPDQTLRIQAHRLLGYAYADVGCHDEGIEHLHTALALAEEHQLLLQQAHTHRALAWAWAEQEDNRHALAHAISARRLFRAVSLPVWEADALNGMGWYEARLGEYDAARNHCVAALTQNRHHHHMDGEANSLDSLGYIAHHTGHHEQAIDYYQQAVSLYRALGYTTEAATTLDNLGHPYVTLGNHDRARVVWQEALQLYQEQSRDTDADRVRQQLRTLDQPSE